MITVPTKPTLQAQSSTDPTDPADTLGESQTAPDMPPALHAGRGPAPNRPHRKKRTPRDHRRIGPPIPHWKSGRRPRRDARMGYPARRRDGDWMTLRRVKERPHHPAARSRKGPIDQDVTSEDEEGGEDPATS